MGNKKLNYKNPGGAGMNVTRKMRVALLMIREDSHYICEWQTIVRLTEAGFISYVDGRACITSEGRELLPTYPRPKCESWKASPESTTAMAKFAEETHD